MAGIIGLSKVSKETTEALGFSVEFLFDKISLPTDVTMELCQDDDYTTKFMFSHRVLVGDHYGRVRFFDKHGAKVGSVVMTNKDAVELAKSILDNE